ncbi:sugar kinase [Photobacterium ganghwense]|uniref:sugar kinase n=1 Tax=Photobacterium ganghwense TaxID=320778 RepID=UPI0040575B76
MLKVAIIGECMIEINGELFGQTTQSFGGDTLNTAVYLARASEGLEVSYVTVLGTDVLSEGLLSRWQAEGVKTDLVLRDSERQPGLYMIQLDEQGERSFEYWRSQSAARYLMQHPDFSAIEPKLNTMDMVYLSGISLAILPQQDRLRLLAVLARLHCKGVEIVFDSNFRAGLWLDLAEARECYRQVYAMTSIALVTDEDEAMLWGDTEGNDVRNIAKTIISRISAMGVGQVVIKQGENGAVYQNMVTDSASTRIPTIPVPEVVDTTSAGDAFNAGFLAGYLMQKSIIDCVTQGHLLAGKVIQFKGAIIPRSVTTPVIKTFRNLPAL